MKKLHFFFIGAIIGVTAILSSCSSSSTTPPPDTTPTAKLDFKNDFHAVYDISIVDTADASGNNGDMILGSTRKPVSIIVTDTNNIIFKGKTGVALIVTYDGQIPIDSEYFYQDPNGDLYRYNFGFSILNQFSTLTQAIGNNVDVGWVLAAKMTSAENTTWVARTDSVLIQSFNLQVYLTSQAQMMRDTIFFIGSDTVKARHARNTVTADAAGGLEHGQVIIDSYYSTEINAVVVDFFRHVKLSGSLLNQQAQGKFKIMTSHN